MNTLHKLTKIYKHQSDFQFDESLKLVCNEYTYLEFLVADQVVRKLWRFDFVRGNETQEPHDMLEI